MNVILFVIQLAVTLVVGVYFASQLRTKQKGAPVIRKDSVQEMNKLTRMRKIALTEPLSEHVRPEKFSDIIGQEDGIRALKAILCGKNPQHVLIYGPPGIGKTCAARLVLEYAKHTEGSPFRKDAPFIEMDATCVRFDERAIADPLIGSVHDPIYQGAGPLGVNGVPQPKPGAVSRAHGGVLFLDEIGEMHPIQMNKLLKVLEDRRVQFESAYYNPDDPAVPKYIHDIFKNGLPADFRLVGATTRSPEDLPPALRSRCMEIYFRPLDHEEVASIAMNAAKKAGFDMSMETARITARFASCGRDAVNMVQMASGVAQLENRRTVLPSDMEWVAESGHYPERPLPFAPQENRVGQVHALAVQGAHIGTVMEVEAVARRGSGRMHVTGIVEEEEMGTQGHMMRRKSMAACSLENVETCLRTLGYLPQDTDVHINFPGGVPVDGPSAGLAMALAAVSAIQNRPVDGSCAVTGEMSVQGYVRPVGGVMQKVLAAKKAGLQRVLIPRENHLDRFDHMEIEVIVTDTLAQALDRMLLPAVLREEAGDATPVPLAAVAAATPTGEMAYPVP
ncbi:MAG: ATP-dependent protease LonB [Clostridiales bacterium]|nr:ATP-dependent protease LonB [Clostridiales bacterium]